MAGQPVPVPARDPAGVVLCIEDIRQSALKKLPRGIAGTLCSMNWLPRAVSMSCIIDEWLLEQMPLI